MIFLSISLKYDILTPPKANDWDLGGNGVKLDNLKK